MRGLLYIASILGASCMSSSGNRTVGTVSPTPEAGASAEHLGARITSLTDARCPAGEVAAIAIVDGQERGAVCPSDATAHQLTIVDLTDAWTPALFAPAADGQVPAKGEPSDRGVGDPLGADRRSINRPQVPSFRASYLAIANERDAAGKKLEGDDALDELYGVVPALAIVRARLADDARHACHAAIDPKPIAALDYPYSLDDKDGVRNAELWRAGLEAQLERERTRRQLPDIAALAALPPWTAKVAEWQKLDTAHRGLVTAEREFQCEGWLGDKELDGSFTWRTGNAVELFQRRNFLMPTERLDAETREAMQLDSHELDYRLALRVLRERVADATGLIEDGTAGAGPQPIMGRMLDPVAMRTARGGSPLPDAAPDLISAATEAAAKQLGWTGPSEVRAFLERRGAGARFAIALPPIPAYHTAHMELSAEVDRGDVFYDEEPPPFRRIVAHRPTLTVFATIDQAAPPSGPGQAPTVVRVRKPLVRWPTTIGGWADVRLPDGSLVQRWKESEVGPRLWRDVFAGPTWLAPRTTPDRELVKNLWNGHWGLKTEEFGPGPHAAYGMVLIEMLQAIKLKDGTVRLDDNGIGTHGSASVTSIVNGTSHGCHRLYNQLAVRLGDFLLRHRDHIVRGEQPEQYRRWVHHNDETFKAAIDTRGFLYELTPPVPVVVLKGNILSKRKVPPVLSAPARP